MGSVGYRLDTEYSVHLSSFQGLLRLRTVYLIVSTFLTQNPLDKRDPILSSICAI